MIESPHSNVGMFMIFRKDRRYIVPKRARNRTVKQFFAEVLPDEFTENPWYILFWRRLLAKHKYVCFLSPRYNTVKRRSMRWVMCIGRIINVLFIDTIINVLVVDNNNICGSYTTETECNQPRNLNLQDSLCTWGQPDDDQFIFSCSYNDPSDSYTSALIVTFLIVIFSAPLDSIVEYLCAKCILDTRDLSVRLKEKVEDEEIFTVKNDEMRRLQTQKSRLMSGARLDQMQRLMDGVTPQQELDRMVKAEHKVVQTTAMPQAAEIMPMLNAYKTYDVNRNNGIAGVVVDAVVLHESSRLPTKTNTVKDYELLRDSILSKINAARNIASDTCGDMRQMSTDEDKQEKYLMKLFLVNSLVGARRVIAKKYFYDSDELEEDDRQKITKIIASILLPLYLIAIIFYIYLYGVSLGPSATNIWLTALAFDLAQDIIILQPMLVLFNFTILSFAINSEIKKMHNLLRVRVRFVMKRTRGILRNASEVIQHINPACRTARKFPQLMTSRLLINLNDYDFPQDRSLSDGSKSTLWKGILAALSFVGIVIIVLLTFLPEAIQETVLNVMVSGGFSYGIVMIATMSAYGVIEFVIIVFVILLLIFLREYYLYRKNKSRVTAEADPVDEILYEKYVEKIKEKPIPRPLYDTHKVAVTKEEDNSDINRHFHGIETLKSAGEATHDPIEMENENQILEEKNAVTVTATSPMEHKDAEVKDDGDENSVVQSVGLESQEKRRRMDDDSFFKKHNIPMVSGPPIQVTPWKPSTDSPRKQGSESPGRRSVISAANDDNNSIGFSSLASATPTHASGNRSRKGRLPWDTGFKRPRNRMNNIYDNSFLDSNLIGGKMPKLEGPGARARRLMNEELMTYMGRTPEMDPDVKTAREVVSANPFETNYTLDDVFQAFSDEIDKDQVAFMEEKRSREAQVGSPKASDFGSRRRNVIRSKTDYPMWM